MDNLEKIIRKYQNNKFVLIEPCGNNGDLLIYKGMEKKLMELNIDYVSIKYTEDIMFPLFKDNHVLKENRIKKILTLLNFFLQKLEIVFIILNNIIFERLIKNKKIFAPANHVFLIHGGGNVNDHYGKGLRILKNVIHNNPDRVVIVAPQTYWFRITNFKSLFSSTKQEIHLFCRERYSYNLLRSLNLPKNVKVYLSEDTAFYLSKSDFHPYIDNYSLLCLREDIESLPSIRKKLSFKNLKDNLIELDVSRYCDYVLYIKIIEGAKKVYTDRLHVAILSAILGKDTIFLPNSYYKNKGVYEYSLSQYENVRFLEKGNIS